MQRSARRRRWAPARLPDSRRRTGPRRSQAGRAARTQPREAQGGPACSPAIPPRPHAREHGRGIRPKAACQNVREEEAEGSLGSKPRNEGHDVRPGPREAWNEESPAHKLIKGRLRPIAPHAQRRDQTRQHAERHPHELGTPHWQKGHGIVPTSTAHEARPPPADSPSCAQAKRRAGQGTRRAQQGEAHPPPPPQGHPRASLSQGAIPSKAQNY